MEKTFKVVRGPLDTGSFAKRLAGRMDDVVFSLLMHCGSADDGSELPMPEQGILEDLKNAIRGPVLAKSSTAMPSYSWNQILRATRHLKRVGRASTWWLCFALAHASLPFLVPDGERFGKLPGRSIEGLYRHGSSIRKDARRSDAWRTRSAHLRARTLGRDGEACLLFQHFLPTKSVLSCLNRRRGRLTHPSPATLQILAETANRTVLSAKLFSWIVMAQPPHVSRTTQPVFEADF